MLAFWIVTLHGRVGRCQHTAPNFKAEDQKTKVEMFTALRTFVNCFHSVTAKCRIGDEASNLGPGVCLCASRIS